MFMLSRNTPGNGMLILEGRLYSIRISSFPQEHPVQSFQACCCPSMSTILQIPNMNDGDFIKGREFRSCLGRKSQSGDHHCVHNGNATDFREAPYGGKADRACADDGVSA